MRGSDDWLDDDELDDELEICHHGIPLAEDCDDCRREDEEDVDGEDENGSPL